MIDAIVLAGGSGKPLYAGAPEHEALLDIGGKPMLLLTLDALAKSGRIGRVFVVGPVRKLKQLNFPEKVCLVQSGQNLTDTIASGVKAAGGRGRMLIAAADLPFLTSESVDDFLAECENESGDLYYAVVAKARMLKKFPKSDRTYVRLRDGVFTGGNLFFVNAEIMERCMEVARRAVENRKKPWRLASLMGWRVLLKFIFRRLSLEDIEARLSAVLGITGRVIQSKYPEIGMDVDKISDLEIARNFYKREST